MLSYIIPLLHAGCSSRPPEPECRTFENAAVTRARRIERSSSQPPRRPSNNKCRRGEHMDCSPEQAFSLFFQPWCERGTEIVFVFDRGIAGSERCQVIRTAFGELTIQLKSAYREHLVDLSSARFKCNEWRSGLVSELLESKWESFVLAQISEDRSLLFAKPR